MEDRKTDQPEYAYFVGKWGEKTEGHLLVYHLLDIAAVALELWKHALTESARAWFAAMLGLSVADTGLLIAFWVCLHDLGKATPAFQFSTPVKALLEQMGFAFPPLSKADVVHHSLLSQLIAHQNRALLFPSGSAHIAIGIALGGHHGKYYYGAELDLNDKHRRNLGSGKWDDVRKQLIGDLTRFLHPSQPTRKLEGYSASNTFLSVLTGFMVSADWLASQDLFFPYQTTWLGLGDYWVVAQKRAQQALQRSGWSGWRPDGKAVEFDQLFPFPAKDLQKQIIDLAEAQTDPFLMIIEAPTGYGKTEAAWMAADRAIRNMDLRGLYIAMPTMATSNQMYSRTSSFLHNRYPDQMVNLQLAHGNAVLNEEFISTRLASIDDEGNDRSEGAVNAMEWFLPRKRTLLAPFGVGTVDQTFLSVLRAKHYFLRMFGLFHKVIIFDEVHAYDTYMMTIFHRLLGWLRALGCSVILLSATLPDESRKELLHAFQCIPEAVDQRVVYPRVSLNNGKAIQTINLGKVENRTINLGRCGYDPAEIVSILERQLAGGGCAAVICNTVDRAQEVYRAITEAGFLTGEDVVLLHSRMPFTWRLEKENIILRRYGKLSAPAAQPRKGVVVATQIIEQSLDLDFDLMISDLAPVDLLIQRIGRLQRHTSQKFPPLRPAGLEEPLCVLAQPELENTEGLPSLSKDQWVYDRVLLHRTYFTLLNRERLDLPGESDELINQVYSNTPISQCSEQQNQPLAELFVKSYLEQGRESVLAEKRLVPDVDDSVAFKIITNLPEGVEAESSDFSALTRNIELPAVSLVCFEKQQDQIRLLDGSYPLDPSSSPAPTAWIHMQKSSVNVTKRDVVAHFRSLEAHKPWSKIGNFKNAFPVVFENGECQLNEQLRLRISEELGLVIE